MDRKDAEAWFGVPPPDLTVIARSRGSDAGSGADWLYTYLRAFYRDPSRPTGWNNLVFQNVGMPHVLWQLNGRAGAARRKFDSEHEANGGVAGRRNRSRDSRKSCRTRTARKRRATC